MNSTFTNISSASSSGWGGVLYIESPNYSLFTLDCCIFTQCKAVFGGALYLKNPYIYIRRTRFESNSASTNGWDIYVGNTSCFNVSGTLASSVCSTTTPSDNRVYCSNKNEVSKLQNNCSEEVV
jgi:hypothetical protein